MTILPAAGERQLIHDVMRGLGASEPAASAVAEDILEADLHGHESHGIARVEGQSRMLASGDVVASADPVVEESGPASVVVDGSRALGPYAVAFGVQRAIEQASTAGSCTVTIHTHGYAAFYGYYAELAARHDCVGIVMSKSSRWNVHAYGGVEAVLGSNPLAVAIPTEGDPLLLDMSTAMVSNGRIQAAVRQGLGIPLGWAVDAAGQPTTDPKAAQGGATSPFGGAKGYGLGLVIEILGGLLARSGVGVQVDDDGKSTLWSSSAIVLSIAAFIDPAEFRRQTSDYLRQVKATQVAADFDEILIPGERAYRIRRDRLVAGVPVPDEVWPGVVKWAQAAGVDAQTYVR